MNYIPLSKKDIENIFSNSAYQSEYIVALYEKAIPDLYNIKSVNQFPEVSKITSEFIFTLAIVFDKKNHPGIFPGGGWMNSGFAVSENIGDWVVKLDETKIKYNGGDMNEAV